MLPHTHIGTHARLIAARTAGSAERTTGFGAPVTLIVRTSAQCSAKSASRRARRRRGQRL